MAKDKSHTVDWKGLNLVVDEINGAAPGSPTPAASTVSVAAGTDGLSAGTVQEALQDLATRIKALEDVA